MFVLVSLKLLVAHRAIRSSEIDGALGDLPDATARADGLIVDFHAGIFLVILIKPFRIHGVGESGPCTSYG